MCIDLPWTGAFRHVLATGAHARRGRDGCTGRSVRQSAHANIQKNPRRVAATGAALLIGVTLVSTIATGAASAKQTMNEALTTRYSVDMIAAGTDMTGKQASEAAKVKAFRAVSTRRPA